MNLGILIYLFPPLMATSIRADVLVWIHPPIPPGQPQSNSHKLPYFIAYALHSTKLHQSVTFAALILLQHLKAHFPTVHGSSGYRLYISAYMIASKVMCDDTYSNKSWDILFRVC